MLEMNKNPETAKRDLRSRLNKEMLFFDGAMGTQLQAAGLKTGGIPEELNIDSGSLLVKIHSDYLKAGADFITTNTFGCNRLKMKQAKYSVSEMLKAAVRNAKQARTDCGRENDSYIVLDIGPIGTLLKPLGTLSFDEAYDIIKEQVLCVKDEVDAVLLETMTDLYEVKAGILAVKENSDLPVFVTMTFEKSGRTMTGTDTETFVNLAEGLGADVLGVNCSLGPEELGPVIESILSYAHIPVMAQPNAGLPSLENGQTVYKLTPRKFCESLLTYAENGLAIVGGCCGTGPEFIRREKLTMPQRVNKRSNPYATKVSSSVKTISFNGQVVVCGERLNPTGKKKMQEALRQARFEELVKEGLLQEEAGADILDVNVGLPGIDETETMKILVPLLQEVIDAPLQLDSSSAQALEAACRYYNGIPLVNSVNGKEESLSAILPIVKKYGAVIIGLTLGENLPLLAEQRLEIADKIISRASDFGIPGENIIIDCLCLTASAQQKEVPETLKAVAEMRNRGYQTTLGVSNVSFGLPNRPLINRTFLTMALQLGLTLPIMNPLDPGMMSVVDAFNVLSYKDENCVKYIEKHGGDVIGETANRAVTEPTSAGTETKDKDLYYMIYHGLKASAKEQTSAELKTSDAMTLINDKIIPALNKVGEDYEKGKIFLPQLIQSAETAKAAFEVVQTTFTASEEKKGPVLICTVEGDIHDIGKNIVKVVLESYGYDMIMSFDYLKNAPLAETREGFLTALINNGFKAGTEKVPVAEGCGRTTASAVYAAMNAPHYPSSAMDGIAISARQTFGASETTPVILTVNDYAVVDTGDPVPDRFDAVVMVEDVVFLEDKSVRLITAARPWQYIRQVGEDICAHEMIIPSYTRITPACVGAMLAGGVYEIEVLKKPVVGIIPTGDEIVSPGKIPAKGEIIEFNSSIFRGMLEEKDCRVVCSEIVPDKKQALLEALGNMLKKCDIVLLNAGSSAGRDDYAAEVIGSLGTLLYHGVAIKPGKPAILACSGAKPVIGVPGYPVSGIVVLEELLTPVLDLWYGRKTVKNEACAVLAKGVVSGLKYEEFVRVRLGFVKDKLVASPLDRGAGVVSSFVKADGIMRIPQNTEGLQAGDEVKVSLLRPICELENTVVITGSHDPLIDELRDILRLKAPDVFVASSHVGSMGAIMAAKRGENHMGGVHLLEEADGSYNESYIKKFFPQAACPESNLRIR